jgi:hypothetical protein
MNAGLTRYFFDPANLPACQADFYAVGMSRRFCQNILDYSLCGFSGLLVILQYNKDPQTRFDIDTIITIHI